MSLDLLSLYVYKKIKKKKKEKKEKKKRTKEHSLEKNRKGKDKIKRKENQVFVCGFGGYKKKRKLTNNRSL
jgi:hypothetical protein